MLNSTRVAALVVQERWDDAADVVEALVQSLAAAAGPEHYDVQRIEALLASIRTSQGRPGEARPIQRRWWKTTRQLLGDNHRQTALALSALGNTLGAQGKHRSAAVCLERALRLLREALPREHSEVLSAATNLAEEFVAIGERERAQHLLEEASATFSEEKAPGRRELWQAWDAHARLSGAPVLPSARRAAQLLRVLPERPVPLDLLLAVDSNLFTRATRDQLRELGVLTPTAGDGSRTFAIDFDRCGRVAGEEARSEGDLLLFADIVRQFIEALAVAGEIDRAVELRPYAEAINRYLIDQPSREATEQAIELCIALYTIAGIEDSTDRAVPFRAILKLLDGSVAEAGWVGARIGSAVERLVDIGRPEAALPLAVLSRDLQAHFHGEGHPRTAAATLTVARVLGLQGRYAEAEQLFGAVLGLTVEKLAYPRGVVRRVLCWLRMAPASDEHGRTEWMTLGLFAALGGGEIAQQGSDEAAELNWTEWAWSLVEVADAAIPSATFLPFLRRAPDVFVKHRMCEKAIRAQTMLVMILKRQHGPDDEEVAMQRNKLQQFEAMC
jgi:tetratricopeptide (TPR) repeat protein